MTHVPLEDLESLALGELFGLRRRRRALLAGAHGRVIELGAGTGLNLRHYPPGLEALVLVEPDPAMRRKLARRAGSRAQIVDAGAERLPFDDGSVDTVADKLVKLYDMGIRHIVALQNFGLMPQDRVLNAMKLLTEQVMPRVRQRLV